MRRLVFSITREVMRDTVSKLIWFRRVASFFSKMGFISSIYSLLMSSILIWISLDNLETFAFISCKPLFSSDIRTRFSKHSERICEPIDLLIVAVASWRMFSKRSMQRRLICSKSSEV